MMRIGIEFGKDTLWLDTPGPETPWIVRRGVVAPINEPGPELERALSCPLGAPPLESLARGKRQACIVISDNTRASPSAFLVAGIVNRLAGCVPTVKVLVATGLHAPPSQAAMEELVGPDLAARCDLVSHDARDPRNLVPMGSTPRGLPVLLNRVFAESDLRILTGLVEPHFMAGYSGGRKAVCPGILGQKSIQFLHSPQLLESPQADYGRVAGNPVHEEALWVARKVGVDFIVNVALDAQKRIAAIAAGDLEAAWFECVRFVSRSAQATTPGRYDLVVTSNGGHPLDRNYYQTVKGLVAAARIVKPGGIILMASECRDGLGSEDFRRALEALVAARDPDRYVRDISAEENWTIDQWEVEMLVRALRGVSAVLLYSPGIRADDWPVTCAQPVASLEEGLKEARRRLGPGASVAVMPEGPHVIPTAADDEHRPDRLEGRDDP